MLWTPEKATSANEESCILFFFSSNEREFLQLDASLSFYTFQFESDKEMQTLVLEEVDTSKPRMSQPVDVSTSQRWLKSKLFPS